MDSKESLSLVWEERNVPGTIKIPVLILSGVAHIIWGFVKYAGLH